MSDGQPRRIGVLSDSHGYAARTGQAVRVLVDAGSDMLLHLGDIGGDEVLAELICDVPVRVVFGNCDPDERGLRSFAEGIGLTVDHPVGEIVVGRKRIRFTHGHLDREMTRALHDEVDYLLHGHSHAIRDEQHGPTRIINPGALSRAQRYTVALLKPGEDRVEWLEIPRSP